MQVDPHFRICFNFYLIRRPRVSGSDARDARDATFLRRTIEVAQQSSPQRGIA